MANVADRINEQIDDALFEWRDAMQGLGDKAWNATRTILEDLPEAGRRLAASPGQDAKTAVDLALTTSFQSSSYTRAITTMQNRLDDIRDEIEELNRENFGEPDYNAVRLSRGLTTSTKNEIEKELDTDHFNVEVNQPAIGALTRHLLPDPNPDLTDGEAMSTKAAMTQDMEHRIRDRIDTFTQIRAETLLQQFARRLNDIFGRSHAMKIKFVGPDDADTRDFCAQRLADQPEGGYTPDQIKAWPAEFAPWDGMIPSTDAGSIFVNLGGFGCRHHLEYLTPE